MLAPPQRAFDQDMTGGWRALDNRGCHGEAADLLRDWRQMHDVAPEKAGILFWHEGQMRANAGQSAAAAALFKQSRKTPKQDRGLDWNLYVDGSIAFLCRDRPAFDAARAALAALPRPADFDPRGPARRPIVIAWPLNLDVLAGLARCRNQSYRQAHACAVPMRRVTVPATRR